MKNIKRRLFMAIAALAMVIPALLMAQTGQTSISGSGTASAGLVVPAGYTVMPVNDTDRNNDQILQLNNLTVQSTSGSVPGTIYASQDRGSDCREYMSTEGGASKIYPCPMSPTVLYQIAVQSDTILLLRNRTRASINDFAAGDHINVFGFVDSNSRYVQALIVRDLDKPAVSRYVQLNNLTVLSKPGDILPAYFLAGRTDVDPCISYESGRASGVMPLYCPPPVNYDNLSDPVVGAANMGAMPQDTSFYRNFPLHYKIQVTSATQVMNALRQPIKLGAIEYGHKINVYGRYVPGTLTVEALILRDLSIDGSGNEQSNLTVNVTDNRIMCITIPCGQINGMNVDVFMSYSNGMAVPSTAGVAGMPYVYRQVTVNGQAFFKNLNPGTYIVRASGAGYGEVEQKVVVVSGQANSINLFTSKINTGVAVPVINSFNPNSGYAGTVVTVYGSGFASTGNALYFNGTYVETLDSKDGSSVSFTAPSYLSPCNYDPYSPNSGTRVCTMMAMLLKPGIYPVYVRNANGISNSVNFNLMGVIQVQ